VSVATIRRAELTDKETLMNAANDLAVGSKPPASSSSIRTEAAPASGSASDPQIQARRMTARLGKERVLLFQNEPNKGRRRHRVHR
jgi:hypothetical protein